MTEFTLRNEMTDFQKNYCFKMLDKIEKRPISGIFNQQSNLFENHNSKYINKPKKVMDFQTIRKKLTEGQYKTMNEWGQDVRLIFSNANICFKEDSPIYKMAQDLSEWFERKWNDYPRSEEEQWVKKLRKVQESVKFLSDHFPIDKAFIPEKEEVSANSAEKK